MTPIKVREKNRKGIIVEFKTCSDCLNMQGVPVLLAVVVWENSFPQIELLPARELTVVENDDCF